MDHQITQPSITQLYNISKMILSGVLILVVLVLLITYQKSSKAKQQRRQSQTMARQQLHYRQQLQRQRQLERQRLNNSSIRKSYHFSTDEDYTTKEHQPNPQTDLIQILRQDSLAKPMIFSLQQAKNNFLRNLNVKSHSEGAIYLDETDIAERQKRKVELQKKRQNNIVYQQPPKIKKNQVQKEQLFESKKVQQTEKKTPTIGEKQIFTDKNNIPLQNKLPETKQLDFNKVTLNLPTQGQKEPEAEKKSLFGNTQQFSLPTQPQKKEEKPTLFANLTPTGPSMFNKPLEQPIAQQKSSLFSTLPTTQQTSLFSQKQVSTKPVQKIEKKEQMTQKTQQQPITNLPKPQQLKPASQQPISFSQPSQPVSRPQPPSQIAKPDYLQLLIDFAKNCKQRCELKKTKTNNFGRSISNLKQIYQTSIDFINTINVGDSKQVETLGCVIYDFLLNKTIPAWPKQQGWQMFPPRAKNQTKWKISITTYVLKLNLYRIMGHETLWLIVFGKLLSLLDFTWKRTSQIPKSNQAYTQLDLVKNNYFGLARQDDMAPKYFTRLDLVTYFLFCMTTMDPLLVSEYLCQTAGQDPKTFEEIKKYKYKWSYSYFWILTETILANKTKTYFKPILYMNMLSAIYLQIRKNKLNPTEFADFQHLRKYIVKEAIELTSSSSIQANEEIQNLAEIEQETRDLRFDGEDFLGQVETLNFYFKEKETQYRKATDKKGFEEFQRRCSVFDYFKSQGKNN